jgi:hypothetical protein
MEQLEKLNKEELQDLLKWLQKYSDFTRKIGKRWISLFHRELDQKDLYKVEYTSSMSESVVWEQAKNAFKKIFWKAPAKKDVIFLQNDAIFGGIKIFQNDNMVDLSLSRIENQIK